MFGAQGNGQKTAPLRLPHHHLHHSSDVVTTETALEALEAMEDICHHKTTTTDNLQIIFCRWPRLLAMVLAPGQAGTRFPAMAGTMFPAPVKSLRH